MKSVIFVLALGMWFSAGASASVPKDNYETAKEVCYEHYGCFSSESPWTSLIRPVSALPNPPYEVGTRFLLYTRSNQNENFELMPDNEFILKFSPYNNTRQTVFIVHGFTDSDRSEWVQAIKNALLTKEHINIIVVDWSPGARGTYHKAVANARLVGAQLTRMLKFLNAKASLNNDELRIVGHSIGAHVAGYAGHALEGAIGYITALDAADPYFGGADALVRLDTTDAKYVHAVHTNGGTFGLGISKSFAHTDVYPNGGGSQPGCRDLLSNLVSSIIQFIFLDFKGALGVWACSHFRVLDFYVESILSDCPFVAHNCKNYNEYNNGKCTTACTAIGSCTVLGYGSERNTGLHGNFYLNTEPTNLFCHQSVRFASPVSQDQKRMNGKVTIQIRKYNGETSKKFTIVDGSVSNGQLLNQWLEIPSKILTSAKERPALILRYTRGGLLPITQPKFLSLDKITLIVLNKQFEVERLDYDAVILEAGKDFHIY